MIQVQPVDDKLSENNKSFNTTDLRYTNSSTPDTGQNFNDIRQESSKENNPKIIAEENVNESVINRHSVTHAKKLKLMFTNSIIGGFLLLCMFVFYYVTNKSPKQMILITFNSKIIESIPVLTIINFESLRSFTHRFRYSKSWCPNWHNWHSQADNFWQKQNSKKNCYSQNLTINSWLILRTEWKITAFCTKGCTLSSQSCGQIILMLCSCWSNFHIRYLDLLYLLSQENSKNFWNWWKKTELPIFWKSLKSL